MRFDFISIFPEMFGSYMNESIISRAQKKKLINVKTHNLRDWAEGKHQKVDDRPYGGGVGMVMMVEPIDKALKAITRGAKKNETRVILMSAGGKTFTQKDAKRLSKYKRLVFVCGRYEGVDARANNLVDEQISIGNYVLTGGELPAMVIADAVARHIPGVLGKIESIEEESHSEDGVTEYPQYTRPENYKGSKVPKVLLSGDHQKIAEWRKKKMKKI